MISTIGSINAEIANVFSLQVADCGIGINFLKKQIYSELDVFLTPQYILNPNRSTKIGQQATLPTNYVLVTLRYLGLVRPRYLG